MELSNMLFARAGMVMKKDRERFWDHNNYAIRLSTRFGKQEAGLWFRTQGCRHDLAGGCTMCDYSAGPKTSANYMVECVQQGLEALPDQLWHLLVSPSGSLLDEWEVPLKAREGILTLMGATKHETFSFESRAETIIDEAIGQCCAALHNRPLKVYVGLESANPWVSKYAINKELSLTEFERSIIVMNRHKVGSTANIIIGSPFLSAAETLEDTLRSIQWAFDKGVTECCLFVTHVKKWTSLRWLYEKGLYVPPSLWTLIEVLGRLDPEVSSKHIELAWYSSYGAFNIVSSPTTCDLCKDTVLEKLDQFAMTNDYQFIQDLIDFDCVCKEAWRTEMAKPSTTMPVERAAVAYEIIGRELLGEEWWKEHNEKILSDLWNDSVLFGITPAHHRVGEI